MYLAGGSRKPPTQPQLPCSQTFFLSREAPIALSPGALDFSLLSPAIQDSNIVFNLKVSVQTSEQSGDIGEQLLFRDHPRSSTYTASGLQLMKSDPENPVKVGSWNFMPHTLGTLTSDFDPMFLWVPGSFRQAPAKPQTSDDIATWPQDRGILKDHTTLTFLDP